MPDVAEATAEVGQMILHALQNTFGMGPDAAIAQAQAETGVSDATLESADMGDVFSYMCEQPGLSPEVQSFLNTQNSNYNNYGNVNQGGSSYSGGGSSGGGGGGYSGGGGSNAQIVQQVTQNYNYQEINDNHIDILGPVNGDIDIDQDNDDIDVTGDGNAVNSGDGDQNAATGAGSSAAQSDFGDATSNSGDGAVVAGDDVDLDHSAVGDGNTVIDNEDGNFASGGSNILDNEDGTIYDSSLGFGEGNVQGDVYNEEGAANSQEGNAEGHSLDVNVLSEVDEEHGPGDLNDHGGDPFDGPIRVMHEAPEARIAEPEHDSYEAPAEHFAPQADAEPEHAESHDASDDAMDS
ncbi:MAG TPA: hypothetical protein VLL08_21520 [Kineosporiaceae bacterium]|nr:hypothetical protein [Kineosporiaceae bacterium]